MSTDSRPAPGFLGEVERYYTGRLQQHGATARGVDWPSEASQQLRFAQLLRILGDAPAPSINDLGCGYGGLLTVLDERGIDADYLGTDVSGEMLAAAAARHSARPATRFLQGSAPDRVADYGIASGVFNVRLTVAEDAWSAYVLHTLDALDRTSAKGFAFNCLTSYSDAHKMRADLYYADPCRLFDHCKRHYARNVALLHDYGLYEFTILVRKEG